MIEVLPKVLLLLHSLKKFVVKKEKNIGLTRMRKAWENRARKETPKDGREWDVSVLQRSAYGGFTLPCWLLD